MAGCFRRESLFDLVKESFENKSSEKLLINTKFLLGGLTQTAALFIRDHHSEIEREKIDWCNYLVTSAILSYTDYNESVQSIRQSIGQSFF